MCTDDNPDRVSKLTVGVSIERRTVRVWLSRQADSDDEQKYDLRPEDARELAEHLLGAAARIDSHS